MSDGPKWTPEMKAAWIEAALGATETTFPTYDEWDDVDSAIDGGGE